uniref:Putative early protein E1 n=1 Tax=Tadarida brasiliensis papillomavirus TaxID=2507922 RepID=A0A411EZW4_9PAPI|nr:putative early protein E1 [Tadarida brasiliensis papillomavirus]
MASRASDNNNDEGTVDSPLPGCSYILDEAECSDDGDDDEDVSGSGSVAEDLVDDASVEQGESLSLFNAQTVEEFERDLQSLKRKFTHSPLQSQGTCEELSPRLASVKLDGNRGKKARKHLSFQDDSGIEQKKVVLYIVPPQTQEQIACACG